MLLLGYQSHKHNQSILQLLNLEVLRFILSLVPLPNNSGHFLVKGSGFKSCVAKYLYSYVTFDPMSRPPCLSWLGKFMKYSSMFPHGWREYGVDENDSEPYDFIVTSDRRILHKFSCIMGALRNCNFWHNVSRWYLRPKFKCTARRGQTREAESQVLVYETTCHVDIVSSKLAFIFGKDNFARFVYVRPVRDNVTQIFICGSPNIKDMLARDIIFREFHSLVKDKACLKLSHFRPGFEIAI